MEEGARDSEGMVGMLCVQVGRITVFWDENLYVQGSKGKGLVSDLAPLGLCQPLSDLGAFPVLSGCRPINRVSAPGCG